MKEVGSETLKDSSEDGFLVVDVTGTWLSDEI